MECIFTNSSPIGLEVFSELREDEINKLSEIFVFGDEYWANFLSKDYPDFFKLKPTNLTLKEWYNKIKTYTFDINGLINAYIDERLDVVDLITRKKYGVTIQKYHQEIKNNIKGVSQNRIDKFKNNLSSGFEQLVLESLGLHRTTKLILYTILNGIGC